MLKTTISQVVLPTPVLKCLGKIVEYSLHFKGICYELIFFPTSKIKLVNLKNKQTQRNIKHMLPVPVHKHFSSMSGRRNITAITINKIFKTFHTFEVLILSSVASSASCLVLFQSKQLEYAEDTLSCH